MEKDTKSCKLNPPIESALTFLDSPINHLPEEILIEIFGHCSFSGAWISRSSSPVNLISVSRLWRTIAIDIPCLWQQINIRLLRNTRSPNFTPLLTMFFTNSRGLHLDIKLSRPDSQPLEGGALRNFPYCRPDYLLKYIAAEMQRCERLSGYFCTYDLRLLLSSSDSEDEEILLPFLKELDMAAYSTVRGSGFHAPIPGLFSTASPNLTKLNLRDISFLLGPISLQKFLECCPNLEYLSMGWLESGHMLVLPEISIELTRLHHLEFRMPMRISKHSYRCAWGRSLRMPNLKHFSVTYEFCDATTPCSFDADIVLYYLKMCSERISGLLFPACIVQEVKDAVTDMNSGGLALPWLAIHQNEQCWICRQVSQGAMEEGNEVFEFKKDSAVGCKFRSDQPCTEDIRAACSNCNYDNHDLNGMFPCSR